MQKILITGAAGFIGSQLTSALNKNQDFEVLCIDNISKNHDYEIKLKRLNFLGVDTTVLEERIPFRHNQLTFIKLDLLDIQKLHEVFANYKFDIVIHLAAQTGVRQSCNNAQLYIDNNISAFNNVLECCRIYEVQNFIYASSSSVYGRNSSIPSKENDNTDNPASIYAFTKKSGELLTHSFTYQNNMRSVGLRFFTVYGPWCRTDMAAYIFMKALAHSNPVNLYNQGDMLRDFTYVNDVYKSIILVAKKLLSGEVPAPFHELFNIGNNKPESLFDYLSLIEKEMGTKAICSYKPIQPGEIESTYADTKKIQKFIGFKPDTRLDSGVKEMVAWYKSYSNL